MTNYEGYFFKNDLLLFEIKLTGDSKREKLNNYLENILQSKGKLENFFKYHRNHFLNSKNKFLIIIFNGQDNKNIEIQKSTLDKL